MKFDKMVSEIVSFSQHVYTIPLTKEDVIERYEEIKGIQTSWGNHCK